MTCALNFCGTAGLAKTDKWQKLASILLFLRPVETKLAKDRENTGFGHKFLFSPELADWIKTKFCHFSVFNQFCCVIKIGTSLLLQENSKDRSGPGKTAGPSDHLCCMAFCCVFYMQLHLLYS